MTSCVRTPTGSGLPADTSVDRTPSVGPDAVGPTVPGHQGRHGLRPRARDRRRTGPRRGTPCRTGPRRTAPRRTELRRTAPRRGAQCRTCLGDQLGIVPRRRSDRARRTAPPGRHPLPAHSGRPRLPPPPGGGGRRGHPHGRAHLAGRLPRRGPDQPGPRQLARRPLRRVGPGPRRRQRRQLGRERVVQPPPAPRRRAPPGRRHPASRSAPALVAAGPAHLPPPAPMVPPAGPAAAR